MQTDAVSRGVQILTKLFCRSTSVTYIWEERSFLLSPDEGGLFLRTTDGQEVHLYPESEDEFFSPTVRVRFVRDDVREVVEAVVIASERQEVVWKRIR